MSAANLNSQGQPPPELLQHLGLTPDKWDVLLVGDGSGSRWDYPGGWAVIIFDKETGQRKLMFGAFSDTTVNICELSPYIYAMLWYSRTGPGKGLQKAMIRRYGLPQIVKVHIVTDCEIIAKQGMKDADRDANRPLWKALEDFNRQGYDFTFHYVERDLLTANRQCDEVSKSTRRLITSIEQGFAELSVPDIGDDNYGARTEVPAE